MKATGKLVAMALAMFVSGQLMIMLTGCSTIGNWFGANATNYVDDVIGLITNNIDAIKTTGTARRAVIGYCRSVDPAAYGGWPGDLPDTDVDGETVAQMCRDAGFAPGEIVVLTNQAATAANFERAIKDACAVLGSNDLLAVFFSGHGGQVADPLDPSEEDGMSETLCLYDGQYVDNRFGTLLRQMPAHLRLWFCTDTCNSGSNYRNLPPAQRPKLVLRGFVPRTDEGTVQVIHWGGCADGESSQSTGSGGTFTTAIVDASDPAGTWKSYPPKIKAAMKGSGQVPYFGEYGPVSDYFRNSLFLR